VSLARSLSSFGRTCWADKRGHAGERGDVPRLPRLGTAARQVAGIQKETLQLESAREGWKRSFAGEEGRAEVSMAAKRCDLTSSVRGW